MFNLRPPNNNVYQFLTYTFLLGFIACCYAYWQHSDKSHSIAFEALHDFSRLERETVSQVPNPLPPVPTPPDDYDGAIVILNSALADMKVSVEDQEQIRRVIKFNNDTLDWIVRYWNNHHNYDELADSYINSMNAKLSPLLDRKAELKHAARITRASMIAGAVCLALAVACVCMWIVRTQIYQDASLRNSAKVD